MGYAANTVFILYWNLDQTFSIHRYHHDWFDEYNSRLPMEENHTPGSLLLQQDSEILLHHLDLINFIPRKIDLTSTLFRDTTMTTYEIELHPSGKKIGFNSLDNEYFTIHYVIDTTPNSPVGYQLPTQAKKNAWIVAING